VLCTHYLENLDMGLGILSKVANVMLIRSGPLEEMVQGNHQRSRWQLMAHSRCLGEDGDILKDKVSLGETGAAGVNKCPAALVEIPHVGIHQEVCAIL
jgi:hypothetical protein